MVKPTEEIGYAINGGRQEGAELRNVASGTLPSPLFECHVDRGDVGRLIVDAALVGGSHGNRS